MNRTRSFPRGFVCPRCGNYSHHPKDAIEGYCVGCHGWTHPGMPAKPPKAPQGPVHLVRLGEPRSLCCGLDRMQAREYLGTRDPDQVTCSGSDRFGRAPGPRSGSSSDGTNQPGGVATCPTCNRAGACKECCCNSVDHHDEQKKTCRRCGHNR